jgi:putative transcriptional regulator
MSQKRRYKSDALEAIHTSVAAMYRIGAIDDATMRSFDESCLVVPEKTDKDARKRVKAKG